jgi:Phage tail protein (Tail_P2_I)
MATLLQQLAVDLAAKGAGYLVRGPNGSAFSQASGVVLDFYQERLLQGIRARQPLLCDTSALPYIAADFQVTLYATEPLESQRFRLSQWKPLHRHKGSIRGAMMNLQPFWLPGALPWIHCVHQDPGGMCSFHAMSPGGTYSVVRPPGTGWWTWGQTPPWTRTDPQLKWSRLFWIVRLPPGTSNGFLWNAASPPWNGTGSWDGFSAQAIADTVAALGEFKAAHSRIATVAFTTLQPTDSIPGYSGRYSFNPGDTYIQDASGWTSLPIGNWVQPFWTGGSHMGQQSRFPYAFFPYVDNT